MPIHDWDRVDAGTFHYFHMRWIASICDVLNDGLLPRHYYAMGEQRAARDEPDVLTLHSAGPGAGEDDSGPADPADDAGGGCSWPRPGSGSSRKPRRISTVASRTAWSSGTRATTAWSR